MIDRPTRAPLWQALVLVIAVACVANADVIQKWKTKEGSLYFGDKPPPGSTKVGEEGTKDAAPESAPAPETPSQSPERDRLSIDVSRERNAIEKDLNRDAERLSDVRAKIAEVERWPNIVEPWMEKSLGFANDKGTTLKKHRAEQREIAASMLKSWEKFDDLDGRVRKGFGGSAPDWWRKISCAKCPSRSELGPLAE